MASLASCSFAEGLRLNAGVPQTLCTRSIRAAFAGACVIESALFAGSLGGPHSRSGGLNGLSRRPWGFLVYWICGHVRFGSILCLRCAEVGLQVLQGTCASEYSARAVETRRIEARKAGPEGTTAVQGTACRSRSFALPAIRGVLGDARRGVHGTCLTIRIRAQSDWIS